MRLGTRRFEDGSCNRIIDPSKSPHAVILSLVVCERRTPDSGLRKSLKGNFTLGLAPLEDDYEDDYVRKGNNNLDHDFP